LQTVRCISKVCYGILERQAKKSGVADSWLAIADTKTLTLLDIGNSLRNGR